MQQNNEINNGVMLNAYPDSIGTKFSDTVAILKMSEFKDVFSLLYVLPTFFNSDLDRGFSIIDYNINKPYQAINNNIIEINNLTNCQFYDSNFH